MKSSNNLYDVTKMHFKSHTTFIEVVDGMETFTMDLFSSIPFIREMKGGIIN